MIIGEYSPRRSRGEYSLIITEPEASNCFSINTHVIISKKRKNRNISKGKYFISFSKAQVTLSRESCAVKRGKFAKFLISFITDKQTVSDCKRCVKSENFPTFCTEKVNVSSPS